MPVYKYSNYDREQNPKFYEELLLYINENYTLYILLTSF